MGWRTDWARERVRVRTERKTTDKKQKIHVCGRFAKRTAFFYSIEKSHTFFYAWGSPAAERLCRTARMNICRLG